MRTERERHYQAEFDRKIQHYEAVKEQERQKREEEERLRRE